jgi:uncharacterized Tic20 family protein
MNDNLSPLPPLSSPMGGNSQPLSPPNERSWAMLAHLTVYLNLVTGFLGVIAALSIYLVYKDRSRYVAYQSMQAVIFQLVWWVGGGILAGIFWAITAALSTIIVGLLCVPVACIISLIPLGALVYGTIGAVKCNNGQDFHYWLIGDWARGTLSGS